MPTPKDTQFERFYAPDRAAWRAWLAEHHTTDPGVWLIYYKLGSGKTRVPYPDAVEEAQCFGWIDSRPNTIDAERYMQIFTPRKPKSPWSRLNKERVERLLAADQIAPAGLAVIAAAKADGSWGALDDVEALATPPDVAAALADDDAAQHHFAAFSATTKKQVLWWVASAKRPETRAKRISQLVAAAAQNQNPIAYVRRPAQSQSIADDAAPDDA